MTIVNPRGSNVCIDGETHPLCLTLGALADIETALGGGDFGLLQKRLASPSISDLLVILHALLQGGGSSISFDALKSSDIDLGAASSAIAAAFEGLGDAP